MKKENEEYIYLKGIRVNNLKNIDLRIPRNQLIVITGVSGSGKSSLVFDTIYAEGQRRYIESVSAYARQFLGKISKPAIDYVEGIPPSIVIEQQTYAHNSRSTVGTSSEIYEYLKLLFARLGQTYSPISGKLVKRDSVHDVCNFIFTLDSSNRVIILAPLAKLSKNEFVKNLETLESMGFSRLFVADEIVDIQTAKQKTFKDKVYLLIDRCSLDNSAENHSRIAESIETAYFQGNGNCIVCVLDKDRNKKYHTFSNKFEADGIVFRKPNPNMFTFTNSYGACPTCNGTGEINGISPDLVIPDKNLSVYDGAVACWHGEKMSEFKDILIKYARKYNFPIHKPIKDLSEEEYHLLWDGNDDIPGINGFFKWVETQIYKIQYRVLLSRYKGHTTCTECHGGRLAKDANYVKIKDKTILDLVTMPLGELKVFFEHLKFKSEADQQIADFLTHEINTRITFLCDLGLDYLTLNRLSSSLSGGEAQRVNLATSLGSNLVGALYILDEPSIGLHSVDTQKLISLLRRLRDIGNTVIVVEHDEEMMRAADYIVDIGPLSGRLGGEVVFAGKLNQLLKNQQSITAQYLNKTKNIPVPQKRLKFKYKLTVKNATLHNLKNITVDIPLNVLTVVAGVSGSGKSSLINGIFYPEVKKQLESYFVDTYCPTNSLCGDINQIQAVQLVDQSSIGRSSRSNPATYIGMFDHIRALYANQPLSKARNYKSSFFSFNVEGGRCEACAGDGAIKIKMQFMSDVELPCEECHGTGYKEEVLDVKINNKTIFDVLQMTVNESIEFFEALPVSTTTKAILEDLYPLKAVGLDYIQLGQSSSSLSGGEAQRVKLAYFLSKSSNKQKNLFIFDEPTTGLHSHDISKLYQTFRALIEQGHSVVVIEHNLEIIKLADWIIELGPGSGKNGGDVIFTGTPEDLIKCKKSPTAPFLQKTMM